MTQWQAFDDLMQMERAQELIKTWEMTLDAKRTILATKEQMLTEGSFPPGQTAEETRFWIQHIQDGMRPLQQRIEQTREALSRGPEAVRSWLQQLKAQGDASRQAFQQMVDSVTPPGPQAAQAPGSADVAPDMPPAKGFVPKRGGGGVGQEVPTGGAPEVPGGIGAAPEVPPGGGVAVPPEAPPVAPVAAGEEALAGGDMAASAGAEAVGASRLGRVLVIGVIIAGVAIGGYWAYTRLTSTSQPTSPPPAPTAPQQPGGQAPEQQPGGQPPQQPAAPAAPPTFNINGDYGGTANGAQCAKPECYVTVTKVSDPSGPGPDQAGKITVTFTAVDWKPAFTGTATVINNKAGPMDASLTQDGTVQGSGYTTLTDTTPGSNTSESVDYKLNGQFTGGTSGSPSYTLTMVFATDFTYQLTGTRTG